MRVIAGTCKGRPLKSVKGSSTRPTTDKVKESIFNMIGPYFEGGRGLDLFGGSGGLGIEALSRGLDHMIFVDKEAKAIETIKENLKLCHFEEQAEVYRNDALRALKAIEKRSLQFSLILLDPPYLKHQLTSIIEKIDTGGFLTPEGNIVVEHASEEQLDDQIGNLKRIRHEVYSSIISVSIYSYITN